MNCLFRLCSGRKSRVPFGMEGLFRQFPNTQFVVYHKHGAAKVNLPKNVEVRTGAINKK